MKTIPNGRFRLLTILCGFLLVACTGSYTSYDAEGFDRLLRSDPAIQLVDVRTADEYAGGLIPGAVNIDVKAEDFLLRSDSLLDPARPVAVYCKGGVRSRKAADRLAGKGYTVYNLDKGYDSWLEYKQKQRHPRKEESAEKE